MVSSQGGFALSFPLHQLQQWESFRVKDHQQILGPDLQASSQYPHQGAGISREECRRLVIYFQNMETLVRMVSSMKPLPCTNIFFLPWKS